MQGCTAAAWAGTGAVLLAKISVIALDMSYTCGALQLKVFLPKSQGHGINVCYFIACCNAGNTC